VARNLVDRGRKGDTVRVGRRFWIRPLESRAWRNNGGSNHQAGALLAGFNSSWALLTQPPAGARRGAGGSFAHDWIGAMTWCAGSPVFLVISQAGTTFFSFAAVFRGCDPFRLRFLAPNGGQARAPTAKTFRGTYQISRLWRTSCRCSNPYPLASGMCFRTLAVVRGGSCPRGCGSWAVGKTI